MTKKEIYGLIFNDGDGKASLEWFSDWAAVEARLTCDESETGEDYSYFYGMNDDTPAVTLTVTADFDFGAAGIIYIDDKPAASIFK